MADPRSALDRAVRDDSLTLLYHPIHAAKDGTILAAEALTRQLRQNGEIREAGIITAAAEESSRRELFAFDSWMMRTAFDEAARWSGPGSQCRLNVNLSPREFEQQGLSPRLEALLGSSGLDAGRVSLEITEVSYIANTDRTTRVLQEIRKSGVALWLDDFGTHYSTLSHLHRFPVDGVKIPADFVAALETDARGRAITAALISLAHELGLGVIAEGVERKSQLAFLIDHGCEMIQGFLFSRPMEGRQIEKVLQAG